MYCFVLEWTPSLSIVYKTSEKAAGLVEEHTDIPHGHIFAGFMVNLCCSLLVFGNPDTVEGVSGAGKKGHTSFCKPHASTANVLVKVK